MPPGGLEGVGPPGHINGGFDMSSFNTPWSLAPSMAGQPAYQSPQINFGGSQPPSMNQGFNSLHTATQQHQWNLGNHLPPRNPSLNDFGLPKLFDPQVSRTWPAMDNKTSSQVLLEITRVVSLCSRSLRPMKPRQSPLNYHLEPPLMGPGCRPQTAKPLKLDFLLPPPLQMNSI